MNEFYQALIKAKAIDNLVTLAKIELVKGNKKLNDVEQTLIQHDLTELEAKLSEAEDIVEWMYKILETLSINKLREEL